MDSFAVYPISIFIYLIPIVVSCFCSQSSCALLYKAFGFSLDAMSSLVRFSKHNYVEYRAGSLNIIISVPHGGSTKPPSIKPRDSGGFLGN